MNVGEWIKSKITKKEGELGVVLHSESICVPGPNQSGRGPMSFETRGKSREIIAELWNRRDFAELAKKTLK